MAQLIHFFDGWMTLIADVAMSIMFDLKNQSCLYDTNESFVHILKFISQLIIQKTTLLSKNKNIISSISAQTDTAILHTQVDLITTKGIIALKIKTMR